MSPIPSDVKKQSIDVVHNVTDAGGPIKKRVSMPEQSVSVYNRFADSDLEVARFRKRVQGQINGNRPYVQAELQHRGQGWRANFNAGEAEALRDTNAASYWSLLMDTPALITCKVRRDKFDSNPVSYGEIIAEEYTATMTEWPDFYYNVLLHAIELFSFGTGPMIWRDAFDFRPKAYKAGNVLLSPKISSAVGEIEIMFLRDELSSTEASKKISEPDTAKEYGWNVPALRAMMKKTYLNNDFVTDDEFRRSPVESVMQALKNHDSMLPFWDTNPMKVVHLWIKQVASGKISHFIFEDSPDAKEYLLEANDAIEDMQHVLCMFTNGIGDGYMRSIRGLGQKMFPHIEVSNRTICSTIDTARITGSLILSGGSNSDNTMMVVGPVARLPDGAVPIQSSFAPRLDQMIMVRTMLQQILNNNHGVYQKAVEYPNMPERTALEVKVASENEARFSNFAIVLYYTHWDRCHREIFRRLVNKDYPSGHPGYEAAKEFRDRCIERGVPAEYLDSKKCRLKAMRAIGSGSPAVRKMVTQEILNASAMFRTEEGRRNALRDFIAARVGADNVDRYEPVQSREEMFTSEHTIALLESHDMAEGVAMPVPSDQPHLIHLAVHLQPLQEIAAGIMDAMEKGQPINPQAVLPYFSVAIPHVATTVELAARDPRNRTKIKAVEMQVKQLAGVLKMLEAEAERQAKQEMQQQQEQMQALQQQMQAQPSPELQAKLEMVRGELMIKEMAMQKKAQLNEFKTRHDAALKDFKAQADIMRQNALQAPQAGGTIGG